MGEPPSEPSSVAAGPPDADSTAFPRDPVRHRFSEEAQTRPPLGETQASWRSQTRAYATRLGCRVSPATVGVGRQRVRFRPAARGGGGRPGQAAARTWRWSLRRLWVAVISRHSVRTAPRPRRLKRSRPRLNFIWANTGSIIGWRLR